MGREGGGADSRLMRHPPPPPHSVYPGVPDGPFLYFPLLSFPFRSSHPDEGELVEGDGNPQGHPVVGVV